MTAEEEAEFLAAVEVGLLEVERGDVISHEAVNALMEARRQQFCNQYRLENNDS